MKRKKVTQLEMASKIRAGINFDVANERERKMALTAAKYLGAEIHTRKLEGGLGGFRIHFLSVFTN